MKQTKLYCVIFAGTNGKDNSIYVCASNISEACVMGGKFLEGKSHSENPPYIKHIQECKIKPYVELKEE